MSRFYKCFTEDCQDAHIYRHPGLCRSCTTYDDNQKPVDAIKRERCTQTGTLWIPMESNGLRMTKPLTRREKMQMDRERAYHGKVQTKIRKAKQQMARDGIDPNEIIDNPFVAQAEAEHDCCAQETCEHKLAGIEIGESVGEEE